MTHDAYKEVEALKAVLTGLLGITTSGRVRVLRFALGHFEMIHDMREHLCHRPECKAGAPRLLVPADVTVESAEADHGKLLANYAVKDADLRRALDRVAELERQVATNASGESGAEWALRAELDTAKSAIGPDRLASADGYLNEAIVHLVTAHNQAQRDAEADNAEAIRARAERDEAREEVNHALLAMRDGGCIVLDGVPLRDNVATVVLALRRKGERIEELERALREWSGEHAHGRRTEARGLPGYREATDSADHDQAVCDCGACENARAAEASHQPETMPAPPEPEPQPEPEPEPEPAAEPTKMPAKRGGLTADEAMEAIRAGWVVRDKEGYEWRWHRATGLQILEENGRWRTYQFQVVSKIFAPYSIERRADA